MRKPTLSFLFGLLSAFAFTQSYAEDVDMQALVRETQISRQANNQLDLVWWIPTEFWRESFRRSGNVAQKQADEMLAIMEDYVLVAVLESKVGALGVMSSTSKEELEKKTTFTIGTTTVAAIPEAELSGNARTLIQMIKPVIANMIGQMGQGMQFLAFKGKDEKGKALVNAREKGRVTVGVGEKKFDYSLPLGALMPAKFDADTGERFPGNYIYSPYTGKKLKTGN